MASAAIGLRTTNSRLHTCDTQLATLMEIHKGAGQTGLVLPSSSAWACLVQAYLDFSGQTKHNFGRNTETETSATKKAEISADTLFRPK